MEPDLKAMTLKEAENWKIKTALAESEGNIKKAAAVLKISRSKVYRYLAEQRKDSQNETHRDYRHSVDES